MPLVFPILAVFHLLLLAYALFNFWTEWSSAWGQIAWLLAYTVAWTLITLGQKWAAFFYWGLMVSNLLLLVFIEEPALQIRYTNAMAYLDVVFSLVLLIYYKRI